MHTFARLKMMGWALSVASAGGLSAASIVEIKASADVVDYSVAAGATVPASYHPPLSTSEWWQALPSGATYYSGPYRAQFEVSFDRDAAPVAAGDDFKVFAGFDARLSLGGVTVALTDPTVSISRSDAEGDFHTEFPFPYHFTAVGPDGSPFSLFGGDELFLEPTLTLPSQAFGYSGSSPFWDAYLPGVDGNWYLHVRDMTTMVVGAPSEPGNGGGPIVAVPDAASTWSLLGAAILGMRLVRRRSA